jgi:hypothetical protein
MNQNPFSIYDFLGYLIPGGLFLYLFYFCGITLEWEVILQLKKIAQEQANALSLLGYTSAVILAYVIGHAISIVSAFFIEKYMNDSLEYPSIYLFWKMNNNFKIEKSKSKVRALKYLLVNLLLLPILIIDKITFNMFYSRELTKELAIPLWEMLDKAYDRNFSIKLNQLKTPYALEGDLFRLAYHYAYEHSAQHQAKIQNYVALYGFCRNVCFVFLIFFWVSTITAIVHYSSDITIGFNILALIYTLSLTYIFYSGFVKFYRRYSLEVLMAFSVIK